MYSVRNLVVFQTNYLPQFLWYYVDYIGIVKGQAYISYSIHYHCYIA